MFIRYNETAKYWEYDSSLAKAGGGPWIILPIDINQIYNIGIWQDIPFDAANFVGSGGMTWTVTAGNILTNAYTLIGKTMFWSLFIAGSTIGGTVASSLSVVSPFNFSTRYQLFKPARLGIGVTSYDAEVYKTGSNRITIIMGNDAPFPALGAFRLDFTGFFEIL